MCNSGEGCSRASYNGINIFPFSWKYLRWYVLFIRAASYWEFAVILRSTNTPRFFSSSVISNWWAPSLQQILVSNPQVHDLVLSTIKFHPISNVPALNVIQLFQQYRYSLCTAGASQLRAISKCHQLIPTFCSKTRLKNIVQDQKNIRHASLGQPVVPVVQHSISERGSQQCCFDRASEPSHFLLSLPFALPAHPQVVYVWGDFPTFSM